jgi:hypothetical protein
MIAANLFALACLRLAQTAPINPPPILQIKSLNEDDRVGRNACGTSITVLIIPERRIAITKLSAQPLPVPRNQIKQKKPKGTNPKIFRNMS